MTQKELFNLFQEAKIKTQRKQALPIHISQKKQ